MNRTHTKYTSAAFTCPLGDDKVHIHARHNMHADPLKNESSRTLNKIECNKMQTCGIAVGHDASTSFDWSKCAFFQLLDAKS